MKGFRFTILCLLLCLLAAFLFSCGERPSTASTAPVGDGTTAPEEEKKVILFLGDSIGEALAGTTPLTEREAYGYYGVIGNINGFDFYNRAVTGYTTADLLALVQREDDGVNRVKTLLSTADIIHISILGNDFLNSNHAQMMIDLSNGVKSRITSRQVVAKANLEETFRIIRSLNPTATLLVQNLYNPTGPDSPLITYTARRVLAEKGIEPSGYHALMDEMIAAINQVLTDYIEEHTATDENGVSHPPFELVDVYTVFEEIYREDFTRWKSLFCGDGMHTVNEGYALMAGAIQSKLEELSLASPYALHRYKQDKVRQIKRLYAHLADPKGIESSIMRAESMKEATEIYFDNVREETPVYSEEHKVEGKTFREDKSFEITKLKLFGNELTSMVNQSSRIAFRADGSYELTITFKSLLTSPLRSAIREKGSFDLDEYFNVALVRPYIENVAPGVDPTDLKTILEEIEKLYGISLIGIDYEKESVRDLLETYKETGKILLTDPNVLEKTVGVRLVGSYRIESGIPTLAGDRLTAIYVNNAIGRGEPFVRYTYTEGEESSVRMTVDVINIEVEGTLLTKE